MLHAEWSAQPPPWKLRCPLEKHVDSTMVHMNIGHTMYCERATNECRPVTSNRNNQLA